MIVSSLKFFDVCTAATSLSHAAYARYIAETDQQAAFQDGHIQVALGQLLVALDRMKPAAETFLVVDEDGTFREAQRGQTRASVVEDIATGEYEAEQVFRLAGPVCEDVTAKIVADVLERLQRTGPGRKPYIPSLLVDRMPDEAEALRLSWMTPAERCAERDEIEADRRLEAQRDAAMEAAE